MYILLDSLQNSLASNLAQESNFQYFIQISCKFIKKKADHCGAKYLSTQLVKVVNMQTYL